MILYFSVHEQTVSPLGSTSVPRVGSSGYLQLSFEFDESWDKFPAYNGSRTIFFQKDKKFVPVVLDESGIVDVPPYFTATAEGFMIMLVGISGSVTCPTNAISISLEPGGEAWRAEPADLNIPAYQQLVMLAQQAVAAAEEAKIPIVRGQSEDGVAYVAAGGNLPGVKPGSNGAHAGKGKQIIFIPDHSSNTIESPTLQINGGDAIPIRMRAPKNQGADGSSSDATLPVPVGALMFGVPYTMTFCGMYWLVDSQIAQYACAEDLSQAELLRDSARQLVSLSETATIGMPIINSMDGVGTAKATIVRSETEDGNPDVSGNVTLPTEARVKEMTGACVVNMTKNADGTYTADKTFAALKAAHDAGKTVICSFKDLTRQWDVPVRLPLVYLGDTYMGFAAVVDQEQGNMVYLWAYINNGGMGHTATEIATEEMTEAYVVNMTKNADGTYTADKTFAALKAAHDAGKTVICSFQDLTQQWDRPVRLPVVDTTDVHMGFAGVIEPRQNYKIFAYVYINSVGMGYTATEIATNDTVSTMIAAAIGDTATALSDMDSVIGGAGA